MRKLLWLLVVWFISSKGFTQTFPELIIKDVNIIPIHTDGFISKRSIAVTNGVITEISDFKYIKKGKNTKVLNGANKFMMPGLAEMHSHLPAPEKIDTYLIANVAAGVTRLRAMNSEAPVLEMKKIISNKPIAPHIYYPYIFTDETPVSTPAQMDSLIRNIQFNKYDFIKLFSIANEQVFDLVMKSAHENKITVCGHYPQMVSMDKLLKSGFKSIEHIGGYTKITDATQLENMLNLTLKNQVYNCPTIDWLYISTGQAYLEDYKKRLVFYNAPKHYVTGWNEQLNAYINTEGEDKILKNKESYQPTFTNKILLLKKLNDNKNLLLLGSDPGGLFQLHGFNMYEEMVHWSNAGISNYDILKAATINAASFFNEETQWGTVEVGKMADLILLDKNPLEDIRNIKTVSATFIKGEIFWKKKLLKKI